eukprot:1498386-Rhodomonas_salina.1
MSGTEIAVCSTCCASKLRPSASPSASSIPVSAPLSACLPSFCSRYHTCFCVPCRAFCALTLDFCATCRARFLRFAVRTFCVFHAPRCARGNGMRAGEEGEARAAAARDREGARVAKLEEMTGRCLRLW